MYIFLIYFLSGLSNGSPCINQGFLQLSAYAFSELYIYTIFVIQLA